MRMQPGDRLILIRAENDLKTFWLEQGVYEIQILARMLGAEVGTGNMTLLLR